MIAALQAKENVFVFRAVITALSLSDALVAKVLETWTWTLFAMHVLA